MTEPRNFILAVDPGTWDTAWVLMDAETKEVCDFGLTDTNAVLDAIELTLETLTHHRITGVVEMIASYGMSVGASVFETCVVIGKIMKVFEDHGVPVHRLTRMSVKMSLCHSPKASDANISAALIDLYGETRSDVVGVKSAPGPLYGFRKDLWAALAVAHAWTDPAVKPFAVKKKAKKKAE